MSNLKINELNHLINVNKENFIYDGKKYSLVHKTISLDNVSQKVSAFIQHVDLMGTSMTAIICTGGTEEKAKENFIKYINEEE